MLVKKIWISPQKAKTLCRSLGLVRQGTLMPVKYEGVLGSLGHVVPHGYYVEVPDFENVERPLLTDREGGPGRETERT